VLGDLDEAGELHRRRAVDVGVAVAGERREAGLRGELALVAGLHLPVADERVHRLHRQVHADDRLNQLACPGADRYNALGAMEFLASRCPDQD